MTTFDAKRHCGGKTRAGSKCLRPKGWKTDHPGSGRCAFHGGATRNGRKAASKEAALNFAKGMLGASVPGSPLDAMQESVDLARGLLAYYQAQIAKAYVAKDETRLAELRGPYTEAIRLEKDVATAAVTVGVAERRQRLAERQADLLAAAIADGLQEAFGDLATPERRTVFAQVVRSRLLVLDAQAEPEGLPAVA